MKVTKRVQKFVEEYEARGFMGIAGAAQAAGYEPSKALAIGRRILAECDWARNEIIRRQADASADIDELIRHLTSISRANLCDFFDTVTEDGKDTLRPRPFHLLTNEQQRIIKSIDKNGAPVLYDKFDALRMLFSILSAAPSSHDEECGVVILPQVTSFTDGEEAPDSAQQRKQTKKAGIKSEAGTVKDTKTQAALTKGADIETNLRKKTDTETKAGTAKTAGIAKGAGTKKGAGTEKGAGITKKAGMKPNTGSQTGGEADA